MYRSPSWRPQVTVYRPATIKTPPMALHPTGTVKVSRPDSVTYLNLTPLFEWCLAGVNDTCLKMIGLSAQHLLAILGSMIDINRGDLCDH